MTGKSKPLIYTDLEVTGMASDGLGIARREGLVVFIENTVTGDRVDARVIKKKSAYRLARPIHFHQYSHLRIEPLCEHFGTCGGCKWQNIAYSTQVEHKFRQVEDALRRIAKLEMPEPEPLIGAPEPYYYRNKLEYTFSHKAWLSEAEIQSGVSFENRNALGFHIPGRFDKVLDIQHCHLQDKIGNAIRLFVKDFANRIGLPFFDLQKQTGVLRTLMLRNTLAGDWMFCLSVTEASDRVFSLLDAVHKQFPQITSLIYTVNAKRNDTLEGLDLVTYKGLPYLTEQMEDLQFRITPRSFYQTNPVQAYVLYKLVREFAGIREGEVVYDLYTGAGTIALFVARQAAKVIGLEYVEDAVRDARVNAKLNGIENASFFAGDIKDILVPQFMEEHGAPDLIITDPPRAGMHEAVCRRLADSGARRIVYVSCNPATQARDLVLLDANYRIEKIQPVDMFPQTTHVENVVLLEKRS